jgi:hypothetical protein
MRVRVTGVAGKAQAVSVNQHNLVTNAALKSDGATKINPANKDLGACLKVLPAWTIQDYERKV